MPPAPLRQMLAADVERASLLASSTRPGGESAITPEIALRDPPAGYALSRILRMVKTIGTNRFFFRISKIDVLSNSRAGRARRF
jgi:hypothetical protein